MEHDWNPMKDLQVSFASFFIRRRPSIRIRFLLCHLSRCSFVALSSMK
uniref:Uncharacterized protein n=1 Tax=Arundo donax TaxID=35708 RepID=A0A0A9CIB8_ARUDO